MTKPEAKIIQELCESGYASDVLEICRKFCEKNKQHCAKIPGLGAIGMEWDVAEIHIGLAIRQIEY